ncbi:unnamed protein product [Gordionus sp. m RMFG-2023]
MVNILFLFKILKFSLIIHALTDLTGDNSWTVQAAKAEGQCGAETWNKNYPQCINVPYTRPLPKTEKYVDNLGIVEAVPYSMQSPIDIRTSETIKVDYKNHSLYFRNYKLETGQWRIKRKSYGFNLRVDGVLPFLELVPGDGKIAPYEFVDAHFHWGVGGGSLVGSEHSIDGKFYPLEVHLVHRSRNADKENYAVVAVFYELIDEKKEPNGRAAEPKHLHVITDALESRDNELKSKFLINSTFSLNLLLPEITWESLANTPFYKYLGSLTNPPCNETVTWLILKEPAKLSLRQLSALENLKLCDGIDHDTCYPDKYVGPNRRPTQSTNKRPIFFVSAKGEASSVILNLYKWQILSATSLVGILIRRI